MNRFYIEKLIVSGGGHTAAVIDFKPGLNFILGPSNTGKSLIMDCLDYIFGFMPKKRHPSRIVENNHGYERITLHLSTESGTVILERKIGDNKIEISSTDPTVENGTYSVSHSAKKNINSVYLHLIGIDESHSVISTETGSKTQELTWRSMLHLFFIKQSDVARDSSALISPGGISYTPSIAVLLYLLTGKDANDFSAAEDPKISDAKKKAVTEYIRKKIEGLSSKRETLEQTLANSNIVDSQATIDRIREKIADIQTQINNAAKESQQLISEIYKLNGKLSESKTISYNFSILRQQYQSDIRRIGFIVEGAISTAPKFQKIKCPICGEVTEKRMGTEFIDASAAELEKIKRHLSELDSVQQHIEQQQKNLIDTIRTLEEKKDSIDTFITEQLQPQISAFETELEQQLSLVQMSGKLESIRQDEIQYKTELFNQETEEPPKPEKHTILSEYDYNDIKGFEDKLKEILQASKVGGAANSRFNMDIFDIEIDGIVKSASMGGGFCGILNTIVTLAMSAYLIETDKNIPGFYIVDSSLTQLSEAEHKEQSETIKQNFIEYLISHAHDRQVIIVEQTKRMPFIPEEDDEKGVHVIQFTRNKNKGRYGFLNDVYNSEDQ